MILKVEFDDKTPRYSSDKCFNCNSDFGKSLCRYKKRGCCFYYPKFNLVDISKMLQTEDGKNTLNKILNTKGVTVFKYAIHCDGYFDKAAYLEHSKNNLPISTLNDQSLHFKACPFVIDGQGCSLPAKYRTPVCNFFICEDIKTEVSFKKLIFEYEKAAENYWRYYAWEDRNLVHFLKENNVNLQSNLGKSLELLATIDGSNYEFPILPNLK